MCSICGIFAPSGAYYDDCEAMSDTMRSRGPDRSEHYRTAGLTFCHNRLAVMDPERGRQPMSAVYENKKYTIIYNGEIYNSKELEHALCARGASFTTGCDTERVLWAYILYGADCPKYLNGIFAFAVYCEGEDRIFLARDRMGVKPLFYTKAKDGFLFASEIKALLAHRGVAPTIDQAGLWQLLFLSPMRQNGTGVFRDIHELPPATCGYADADGISLHPYWELTAYENKECRGEIIEHASYLLRDAIGRQTVSDVPLCTFLSGGLDSSVITAVTAELYQREGKTLSTYSFEYEGEDNFEKTLFTPNSDADYAEALAKQLKTEHTVLRAPLEEVANALPLSAIARDLPGQADIDSSLYYFCREVKRRHTVALSGECSDEIFGGYPWFYRKEMLTRDFFPWIHEPMARVSLFRSELVRPEEGYAYASGLYRSICDAAPLVEGEDAEMRQARIATVLSTSCFMTNLLERKDRMSMAHGLEVRVPFADHRILEYVYNVPWSLKFEDGVEKSLLRHAMADMLPQNVLWRKKSPYPKTASPRYEALVRQRLEEVLSQGDGLLCELLEPHQVRAWLDGGAGGTWFGQLMARPQLMAWMIELDAFFRHYRVRLAL